MTPKQKAEDIFYKIYNADYGFLNMLEDGVHFAKECSLICVDKIVQNSSLKLSDTFIDFWYQVKQEINKL